MSKKYERITIWLNATQMFVCGTKGIITNISWLQSEAERLRASGIDAEVKYRDQYYAAIFRTNCLPYGD